jgi:type I restriction enzyme S subunit
VIPIATVLPQWAYWAFCSTWGQKQITSNASATTLPILNKGKFERLPVPVAPANEQRRIVAKIEELFSDLDAGVAALERVRAKLKRYRAAVLKAAVEGKLTAEWRKKNRPKETGRKLLDRLSQERRRRWEEEQLAAYEEAGKKPPAGWKEKYKEPVGPSEGSLPALPEGWCWASAEQLGNVQLGRQRSPKNRSKNFATKYIRAANITEHGLALDDILDMEFKPNELETYRLAPGDVILSEASGSPDQVGKPAVWNDEIEDCCFQNTVIRLRPILLDSQYLLAVFRHYYWNKVFARVAAGVGINHLSAAKFSRLAVPIAPLNEQLQIVAEVERQLSIAQAGESQVDANLKRSARLRQSILKRAFEGKLVSQDPNDEPASVLLERIVGNRLSYGHGRTDRVSRTDR